MSDCFCSPLPSPSPPCVPIPSPSPECGSIRMFFGYDAPPSGPLGKLDKLFYTDPATDYSIKKGFEIQNYSCSILKKSGIVDFDDFTLFETELLSTGSFESWVLYNTLRDGIQSAQTFGLKCMQSVGIDLVKLQNTAGTTFHALQGFDSAPLYTEIQKLIFPDPSKEQNCDKLDQQLKIEKLRICYDWIKNIYDTYYGREFLVKVAGPSGIAGGICIRDESGSAPSGLGLSVPFYVDGDGSSQGLYVSDEIASDGGFPKKNTVDILGLKTIDWIQDNSGKIQSFVSMGMISASGVQHPQCSALNDRQLYRKFEMYPYNPSGIDPTSPPTQICAEWGVDLSKLDISNYYIDETNNNKLFIKSEIENRFYIDNKGTWVRLTLAEKVPLMLDSIDNTVGAKLFLFLLSLINSNKFKIAIQNNLEQTKDKIGNPLIGAKGNTTQFNLMSAFPPCLMPEGAAIPFKSNVYRYGPYYYVTNPDDGGGVEVVINQDIVPWNFIPSNTTGLPGSYPYCAMDNFGRDIARGAQKGLQKLEKGRATVVGLPCYNLGYSVNSTGVYPTGLGRGPTLLTDMSVEFGSGGFTTLYNFSTYSPRLGKSEKYLLDEWSDNLKKNQEVSAYLRSEKTKVDTIKKDYTKRRIEKGLFWSPKPIHKKSTPNKIILSGYYINPSGMLPDTLPDPYPSASGFLPDVSCLSSPLPFPSGNDLPIPSASGLRSYVWSESDKAYAFEHMQELYSQMAGMSMDGFYMPVSLRGATDDATKSETNPLWTNKARLPRFSVVPKIDGSFDDFETHRALDAGNPGSPIPTKTRDEMPPFRLLDATDNSVGAYLLPIHQYYLNPYTTKAIINAWDGRKNGSDAGFVISSIVFGSKFDDYQISHNTTGPTINSDTDSDEDLRQAQTNFRVPALRGPLVLQGWGYDTSGKPIPNSNDNEHNALYGQFRQDKLTDKFLYNWLENPRTWPVGPIDLRFDRERGVWTCPSPNKIVVARLKTHLCPNGSATAQLLNPESNGIKFYHKYFISGPGGENVNLSMDRTEITVYDFIGESIPACSKVYVYYDDNRYIVLQAVSSSPSKGDVVRFRAIKFCNQPESYYGNNTWGSYAGYGDKYYNYHLYGVRIDCDGEAIDKNGDKATQSITQQFLIDNAENWLIKINDNAGKFGPSFAKFENYADWKSKGATGYGTFIGSIGSSSICASPSVSPSVVPSASPSVAPSASPSCSLGVPVECDMGISSVIDSALFTYDLLFIESYARFIHGYLTQDLYTTSQQATQSYAGDTYKIALPSGNAAAVVTHFYGDAPNGREPIFLGSSGPVAMRVFDPWIQPQSLSNPNPNLATIANYNPSTGPFYNAASGTVFTAVFNEKEKKYYLWQTNKKSQETIRFKAIKLCDTTETLPTTYDNWGTFAGYGDKFANAHTYGVRINCDGQVIDKNGNTTNQPITKQFLMDNATNWLVRLNDNAGKFGPSYAIFTDYATWNSRAATGYATLIDSNAGSCGLGDANDCAISQHNQLVAYDILFIESYARFIECTLTQDLYANSAQYPADTYKTSNPSGNASAYINNYYGDSPNGKDPLFLQSDLTTVPFRVFDPFNGANIKNNPFAHLKANDSVLAIFNEDLKKYIIWQSLKSSDQDNSIVKFALVSDKHNVDVPAVSGVLVDEYARPIDSDGNLLDSNTFNNNIITIMDPIINRAGNAPPPNNGTLLLNPRENIFGPALGGSILDEHYNGIPLGDGFGSQFMAPFIGFAMKRTNRDYSGNTQTVYEMFMLEHYARMVFGRICTKTANYSGASTTAPCYLGSKNTGDAGFTQGRNPVARHTSSLPRGDLVVHEPGTGFTGYHSFLIGDGGVNIPRIDDTDGCGFVATINLRASTTQHLVYEIIDAERVALVGTLWLKTQAKADILNDDNNFTVDIDGSSMRSKFHQGFMWNQTKSPANYQTTKIKNRPELTDRGLFIGLPEPSGSAVSVSLAGIDGSGVLKYDVMVGGTIAKMTQRLIDNTQPGLFGYNGAGEIPAADRKIADTDKFFEGLNASNLDDPNKPIINTIRNMGSNQQWMTYKDATLTAVWNETLDGNGEVSECVYEIIYADQAPVIITGKAYAEIDPAAPETLAEIDPSGTLFPSCRGVDKEPISSGPTALLLRAKNPMGHGAKIGDYVTLQRVYTGVVADNANYYYMIIGTGHPPGDLK